MAAGVLVPDVFTGLAFLAEPGPLENGKPPILQRPAGRAVWRPACSSYLRPHIIGEVFMLGLAILCLALAGISISFFAGFANWSVLPWLGPPCLHSRASVTLPDQTGIHVTRDEAQAIGAVWNS